MQSLPVIKGLQNLRTMKSIQKGVIHDDSNDFLKLYMQEKEVKRLHTEEERLLGRLGVIQNRMRDILEFHDDKSLHTEEAKQEHNAHLKEPDFTTISIDY